MQTLARHHAEFLATLLVLAILALVHARVVIARLRTAARSEKLSTDSRIGTLTDSLRHEEQQRYAAECENARLMSTVQRMAKLAEARKDANLKADNLARARAAVESKYRIPQDSRLADARLLVAENEARNADAHFQCVAGLVADEQLTSRN